MDALATELIKVELGVAGLFLAALKLSHVAGTVYPAGPMLLALTLALTLAALLPARHQVKDGVAAEIEAFFHNSARRKYRLLIGAAAAFCFGVLGGILVITA